jgi:hypothetical protein
MSAAVAPAVPAASTSSAASTSALTIAPAAAAAPNPALDVKQVQVRFVSRVDDSTLVPMGDGKEADPTAITHSTIDQFTYTVPVQLAREGLSELVNTLLKQGTCGPPPSPPLISSP